MVMMQRGEGDCVEHQVSRVRGLKAVSSLRSTRPYAGQESSLDHIWTTQREGDCGAPS